METWNTTISVASHGWRALLQDIMVSRSRPQTVIATAALENIFSLQATLQIRNFATLVLRTCTHSEGTNVNAWAAKIWNQTSIASRECGLCAPICLV